MVDGLITLYFDEDSYNKLEKDHYSYNKNQRISRTIKRVIVNHADAYYEETQALKDKIAASIEYETGDADLTEDEITNIAWKITKYIGQTKSAKAIAPKKKKSAKKKVNIRINKNSLEDSRLEMVLDKRPLDAGENDYLVSIIKSYLELPQIEREKVIYKDNLKKIEYAISNKRLIRFKNPERGEIHTVLPEGIYESDEEIYNYCLYQEYDQTKDITRATSIHLYNMTNVVVEADTAAFLEEVEVKFEKMKRNGVQFNIYDDKVIKVKLTDVGVNIFEKRYIERPDILDSSDLENNIYHFDCGEWHFTNYFAPFYKEVTVLEPVEVKERLVEKLETSLSNYK